ncbi:MAG: metallophosphoesterase [Bacteroidales bacterium]|nr:metallophosphoesterase [Bacteroidales bacterium]
MDWKIKLCIIGALVYTVAGCNINTDTKTTDQSDLYSFFVAGHTYGKPGVDNIGVHPPFRKKFDLIRQDTLIELGVFTGDIVISGTAANWDEIDRDAEELGIPVYFAVGNHDMSNRELYESRYGDTYYSFIYNNDLFIILDPNLDGWNIRHEQLQFLKDELQNNTGKTDNIFVFMHQVLWWSPDNLYKKVLPNSLALRDDSINFWGEVEPLFHSLNNPVFMFAGDVGAFNNGNEYMYHHYDNITLIASGMGGEVRDNFVIVDVKADKTISFRLIALNGDDINALGRLEDYKLEQ